MTTKPLKYTARGWVISFFYIKPQPSLFLVLQGSSWVISFFYIKPQQDTTPALSRNCWVISFFYIKPQPIFPTEFQWLGWVISFFYIKPQRRDDYVRSIIVGLYPSSTSNHNSMRIMMICYVLGYILLLHQTTTVFAIGPAYTSWVISFFYIKPQPLGLGFFEKSCWVISFFYIKPQPAAL